MEQLVQCPVCTLFLHNGISLESHLDTHPKDQVIKALCNLSASKSNYGSRASTPMHSERSFRSRSRTPAVEDHSARWANTHFGGDHDRYWRLPPSCSKSSTITKEGLPSDLRTESNLQTESIVNMDNYSYPHIYPNRSDKMTFGNSTTPISDYERNQNKYFEDQRTEDKEIKYSRSPEYNAIHNAPSGMYNGEVLTPPPPALISAPMKRSTDYVNILPASKKQYVQKHNNIALVKSNMGAVQYITPRVMMSTPKFLQKPSSSNYIVTTNMPSQPLIQTKAVQAPIQSTINPMNSNNLMPNTTVVTQNSQIIYQEMVQNINGKSFIPGMPPVLAANENVTNVARTSSMYQNVMVLDQFGNASCMYATPQMLNKTESKPQNFKQACPPSVSGDKTMSFSGDGKTLIIEVAPLGPPPMISSEVATTTPSTTPTETQPFNLKTNQAIERPELCESSTKGLKILSNIKVEVPVQHHKSLLNTVVDLTCPSEAETPEKHTAERLLEINNVQVTPAKTDSYDTSQLVLSNTFSVIKNIGSISECSNHTNPTTKDLKQVERGLESESSDSFPVPDLTCNEKPSLTPCSELSDNCDNSRDRITLSPKPEAANMIEITIEPKKEAVKPYRHIPLRLNNIYVKKNKKILQIKNAKTFPVASTSQTEVPATDTTAQEPPKIPEDFTVTKIFQETSKVEISKDIEVSIKIVNTEPNFDADTEEQSMDLEPEPLSSSYNSLTPSELVTVKDEANTSDEVYTNPNSFSDRDLTALESIRPINVSHYGQMDDFEDDSNHRELLDLEAASKTKQFANMINENYFGDNIYADYFTPDRVDSFEAVRESSMYEKGSQREFWGESSQKQEFAEDGFQQDGYKEERPIGREIDISADEHMPPRGELSGDSNTELDAWNQTYNDMGSGESYDLMARESWMSDGSDVDVNEKREKMCESLTNESRAFSRECRTSATPRLLETVSIKRETNDEAAVLQRILQDSKAVLPPAILNVYEAITEPKIETTIKQEPKRRKKEWSCGRCGLTFSSSAGLAPHLREHPLECLTCGKEFLRRANLQLHLKTHLDIKNYKCEVCGKRFITRQKLTEHSNIHSGRAPIKCTLCDQTFRRYSNMLQHRDRHHLKKKPRIRDFVCNCGAVFHSAAKLRWHKETHDDKPKSCPFCNERFVHSASLTRHIRRAHDRFYTGINTKKGQENVTCHICNQVYLASNLKTHMLTHSEKKTFQCVICNRWFSTKWNLKLHKWTHMSRSSKPFKCTICPSAFIRQPEFIAHMNAHKSVRPYTCNYCGCQFIRKYNCVRHVREHENTKKYVCTVPDCGKTFHRSYYLSEHMKVHSGARPFSCNICGKTSSNKSNHNKHLKIHHAREPVATEG